MYDHLKNKEVFPMKTLREKVAYIRGMAEGMELDRNDARNKLLLQVLELLNDMIIEIDDVADRVDDTEDLIEALDSDLADVEEFIFEDDDDDCCDHDDDDLNEFEIQCPHCNEIVFVDEEDLEEVADDEVEILCPNCNKVIFTDDEAEDDDPALSQGDSPVSID